MIWTVGAAGKTRAEDPGGAGLLAAIRGIGLDRPANDAAQVAALRAELEEAASPALVCPGEGVPVRVTKARLRQVLVCERYLVALSEVQPAGLSAELVAGRLMDHAFGLVTVGCALGSDPLVDALAAAAAAGDTALVADWAKLGAEEAADARRIVEACSSGLSARWPVLPPNALVRLQEPMSVELAGGLVALSGRVDLALGCPGAARGGTTLVDIKSGFQRYDDAADAGWYALLESLRHRAAPFQAGSYYLRSGVLHLEVVTEDLLARATRRACDGVARLVRLAGGAPPHATPNPLCPWCPAIEDCEPGRRYTSGRRDGAPPRPAPGPARDAPERYAPERDAGWREAGDET